MKKGSKNIILWIIIGIVVIALILIIYNANKPQPTQKLTDNDFKILSASWDDYAMEWRTEGYIVDTNRPIDWDKFCDACKNGIPNAYNTDGTPYKPSCLTSSYHLVIDASKMLFFNMAIDGIYVEKLRENTGNEMSSVREGIQNINILLSDKAKTNQQVFSNLDVTKSHDITLCATDSRLDKESNFICKSITLPAKC